MKLSKREKLMILILVGSIIIFSYYKFLYEPQRQRIVELQSHVVELEKNKLQSMELLSDNNSIYTDYKILNSQVAVAEKSFHPSIIQEKIILQLDGIINSTNLNVISLSFTEPEKKEIKEIEGKKEEQSLLDEYSNIYNDLSNEINGGKDVSKESKEDINRENQKIVKVDKMTVNIVFQENDYNEVMNFLTQLELQEKRIVIDNIAIQMEENQLSGIIALDYYSIPKIIKEDEGYNDWYIYGNYGVEDPFTYFEGYDTNRETSSSNNDTTYDNETTEKVDQEVFDFYMGLRSITADLPTVVIGKQNDVYGKSYIYGDNQGIEKVEFKFVKKEGNYYYSYRTQIQSLPHNYEEEMLPFTPRGENIVLSIMSSLRKEKSDASGVYLSLINDTDLKLIIDVDKDDPTKPRINIAKKQGNIVIR